MAMKKYFEPYSEMDTWTSWKCYFMTNDAVVTSCKSVRTLINPLCLTTPVEQESDHYKEVMIELCGNFVVYIFDIESFGQVCMFWIHWNWDVKTLIRTENFFHGQNHLYSVHQKPLSWRKGVLYQQNDHLYINYVPCVTLNSQEKLSSTHMPPLRIQKSECKWNESKTISKTLTTCAV